MNAERRRSKAACAPASSNESSAAARAADASAIAVSEARAVRDDEPRRLRRREAPVEVGAHAQDAVDVLVAVEAEPATRPLGREEAVAALPRAQQLDRHADATGQLTDAEKLFGHRRRSPRVYTVPRRSIRAFGAEETRMRITHRVRIARPPEAVWAIVSDLETHTRWRPALDEFRQVSEGPLGVGSRIREVLDWRGRKIEIDDVVTGFEPPYRFAIHGSWDAAEFDLDLLLEPIGDGATEVTFDWPLYPKSLLMKLATPFLRGTMERSRSRGGRRSQADYAEDQRAAP